ncbi:selenium-binding family protein [Polyangium sorediatum]|uniref:Selenium-binding family protein n=1 Tax=Polyangium sorediatum TaxID=889274 RepID=A0ABT6P8P1_9BACT|nr:selenium-binding family protein [Polyangium sorediatum]MDI1437001.1 selenium-binding family protein [Polyangium sorediatum]
MPFRPDPTFYPSPRMAMDAPRERFAYVAAPDANAVLGRPNPLRDGLATVDLDPRSPTYSQIIALAEVPNFGDELHHSGWNACSAALCPYAPHPHVERRYLMLPALRSSRIYIFDTKADPRRPKLVRTIEADEIASRTGYSRPHTLHCGPDGIYVSALGNPAGEGPGGIFMLDCESFDVLGRWEIDRGPQYLHYDFWWHLGHDTLISSEWGTPKMIEDGVVPELLLGKKYGHRLHVWDLRRRKHVQALDIGDEHQMALELRPAHDPTKAWGFMGVVISVADLSASVWLWYREGERWAIKKVITIPAEPASADQLPPLLKGFGAVPPLVTDINLSLDDKYLYVSCWGTGELRQYDVSNPHEPKHVGSVHIGGIARRTPHPRSGGPLTGAPQMVEVSRDGKRIYFTSGLYTTWDEQFYPDGLKGWMVKVDVKEGGGIALDPDFYVDFGPRRAHQVRLEGGDASSDSFCYP